MKRLFAILPLLLLIVAGCYRVPFADGIVTPQPALVDETITFSNLSMNATHVEWDLGDGSYSTAFNTSYSYDLPGLYDVSLSAFGKRGDVDVLYFDVEVEGDLKVIVKEYFDEYRVADARVRLYPSLMDWDNETNLVAEKYTNDNGEVVFARLNSQRYYVDVFETWHDNYTLAGEEDGVQWIQTPVLDPDFFYIFTAYVDVYDQPAKKSAAIGNGRKMLMQEMAEGNSRATKENVVSMPKKGR